MKYVIGLLVLLVSFSAVAVERYQESGHVEKFRFADDAIAQNSSQRSSWVVLVERPRAAECGSQYSITPNGLKNFSSAIATAWATGKPVGFTILDFEPETQGGCVVQSAGGE